MTNLCRFILQDDLLGNQHSGSECTDICFLSAELHHQMANAHTSTIGSAERHKSLRVYIKPKSLYKFRFV